MALSPCGELPDRAAYLAPGGAGNDQWLTDFGAYINCLQSQDDPSHACPAGFTWEGNDPPNGGCLPVAHTNEQAIANQVFLNGGSPYPSTPEAAVVTPATTGTPAGSIAVPTTPTVKPHIAPTATKGAFKAHYIGGGTGAGEYCDFYPDDPYCDFWFDLGGLAGSIGGGGTTVSQTIVYQTGLLAEDVHSIVDDALKGLWSASVITLDLVLGGIVAGIQSALTAVGNALKAAWNILSRLGGLILNFLRHMWNTVITGLVKALHDIASVLKDLYTKVLRPMLVNLQQLRAKLLDIYAKFIRPALIILQDVRKVLAVLIAFHVPFAKKLDTILAEQERRLTAPLLLLLRYTNSIANWINLIITADYLLQRSVFLNSLKANIGSILNLQINAMTKPLSGSDLAILQANNTLVTPAQSSTAAVEYMRYGTGANAAFADQQTKVFKQYLTDGF